MAKRRKRSDKEWPQKIYFSSEESREQLKKLAQRYDVSVSQMAELLIIFGEDAVMSGDLDIEDYLKESKLPWLNRFAIDLDKFKNRRKKR